MKLVRKCRLCGERLPLDKYGEPLPDGKVAEFVDEDGGVVLAHVECGENAGLEIW